MKKLLLSALLIGLTAGAYAQGTGAGSVLLANNGNGDQSPSATANGLVFLNGALTTTDLNVALFGFTDSTSVLQHPVASMVGSAAAGNSLFGSGTFTDLSSTAYAVDGTTTASTGAFFILQAWVGGASSYSAALAAGAPAGQTIVFANGLGGVGSPPSTTPQLVGMPGLNLTASAVPEPSTFALAGLGAAAMLIFRRRK
jgi:hypothetical protein